MWCSELLEMSQIVFSHPLHVSLLLVESSPGKQWFPCHLQSNLPRSTHPLRSCVVSALLLLHRGTPREVSRLETSFARETVSWKWNFIGFSQQRHIISATCLWKSLLLSIVHRRILMCPHLGYLLTFAVVSSFGGLQSSSYKAPWASLPGAANYCSALVGMLIGAVCPL